MDLIQKTVKLEEPKLKLVNCTSVQVEAIVIKTKIFQLRFAIKKN